MIHKTTRSILSVLLAVLLLITSTPLTPAFADGGAVSLQSESGVGRALEPAADGTYLIYTAENLKEFAAIVNGTHAEVARNNSANARLMNNIVLNEKIEVDDNGAVTNQEGLSEWIPIGSDSSRYSGTFDGNNYTISGLYIDSSSANDQGLFGYVGIVGTVQNLSVSGTVSGGTYVGGVVGQNNGNVEDCDFTGSVTGSGKYVGGVVGYNGDISTVENCCNTGAVSGGECVGGVVGLNSGTVENCYNTGTVTGTDDYVGGVVGQSFSASVTNSYNTGEVSGTDDYVGGVVGWNDSGNVTGCYFLQTETVNTQLQGIGSDSGSGSATPLSAEAFESQEKFTSWDFDKTWEIESIFGRPTLRDNAEIGGTANNPYKIFTATQLETFRDIVNGANGQRQNKFAHAKLMNDIDLKDVCGEEGDSWTPIGNSSNEYTGTFDGQNHTINGLYIDTDDYYQGLFGYVSGSGKIEKLSVSGDINGGWYVGGVVGYNNGGTVTGCTFSVSGNVSGDWHVGGIVGYNGTGATVSNCYNTGTDDYGGGVVGYSSGGVVGYNSGTVENCYNTGSVKGGRYVGGVVGSNSFSATVTNCYNTGTVTGTGCFVGGVVGDNYLGASVENCYNTGTVTGFDSGSDDNYVGGVVGQNSGTVENCYNTSSVSGGNAVGGVVGLNDSGIVENCYNTGTVTGTDDYVGGVVGHNGINSSVTNCYFLSGTADNGIGGGSGTSSNVEARTDDAFHSGEVAYLLEQNVENSEKPVWGQSNLTATTSLPTLVALNPDAAQPVYKVTFKYGYDSAPADEISYSNGSVKFPAFERTGYTFAGWTPTGTTISQDTTFTAQWQKDTVNYAVTVSANPTAGGTVSGGGTFAEGTQVTVTATPATGYHFVNWTENGTEVSTEATFTFNATVDRNLIAIFAKNEEPEPTPTPTPTPDPTPSGPSTGDSSGWDDIRDELENAAKGDEITIDMGDETKVPAEIFESLAGKDVEISFDLGDIQWSASGADIPTDTDFTDLDLGVDLDTSGIPADVINTITGEVGTVQITLAHDGEFGFTMTLSAPLGEENAGYWANLYHYDEEAEKLNFEAATKIDEDGSVTIPFSHASQYAIVIDTHSHATVDVSDLFIDVAPDAWYKDAVQYAYDQGLMTGVSDTEFAPEATTTRAMIVSILARLEGVESAEAAGFADVDDNDWYATAVNWAANVGVVNGYEDNTFRPNTAITREQLAAILMNYAAYKSEDVSNRADLTSYIDQPSTWAQEAISWSVAEGLLTGVTADTLQPQRAATRAQVAAILQRFLSE